MYVYTKPQNLMSNESRGNHGILKNIVCFDVFSFSWPNNKKQPDWILIGSLREEIIFNILESSHPANTSFSFTSATTVLYHWWPTLNSQWLQMLRTRPKCQQNNAVLNEIWKFSKISKNSFIKSLLVYLPYLKCWTGEGMQANNYSKVVSSTLK